MALKDITLGQYFPGNSIVHRLDPRTKLIAVVLYIVALFLAKSFVTYGIMFLLLAVSIAVSKVPVKSIFRGHEAGGVHRHLHRHPQPVLHAGGHGAGPLLDLHHHAGGRVQRFLHGGPHPDAHCRHLPADLHHLPILLTDGLENLLGPLKKIHVPVHELAMMMSIALRFIPPC